MPDERTDAPSRGASARDADAAQTRPRVVELAGGVGGAKLAEGLQAVVGDRLTVVVNTADDTERHGLLVCPDHDTVLSTLAGLDDDGRAGAVRRGRLVPARRP